MCGSGVRIGMNLIPQKQRRIHKELKRGRNLLSEVDVGIITQYSVLRHIDIVIIREQEVEVLQVSVLY
jgi:hypothetical protein